MRPKGPKENLPQSPAHCHRETGNLNRSREQGMGRRLNQQWSSPLSVQRYGLEDRCPTCRALPPWDYQVYDDTCRTSTYRHVGHCRSRTLELPFPDGGRPQRSNMFLAHASWHHQYYAQWLWRCQVQQKLPSCWRQYDLGKVARENNDYKCQARSCLGVWPKTLAYGRS